jgi:hypothetical protein
MANVKQQQVDDKNYLSDFFFLDIGYFQSLGTQRRFIAKIWK